MYVRTAGELKFSFITVFLRWFKMIYIKIHHDLCQGLGGEHDVVWLGTSPEGAQRDQPRYLLCTWCVCVWLRCKAAGVSGSAVFRDVL